MEYVDNFVALFLQSDLARAAAEAVDAESKKVGLPTHDVESGRLDDIARHGQLMPMRHDVVLFSSWTSCIEARSCPDVRDGLRDTGILQQRGNQSL